MSQSPGCSFWTVVLSPAGGPSPCRGDRILRSVGPDVHTPGGRDRRALCPPAHASQSGHQAGQRRGYDNRLSESKTLSRCRTGQEGKKRNQVDKGGGRYQCSCREGDHNRIPGRTRLLAVGCQDAQRDRGARRSPAFCQTLATVGKRSAAGTGCGRWKGDNHFVSRSTDHTALLFQHDSLTHDSLTHDSFTYWQVAAATGHALPARAGPTRTVVLAAGGVPGRPGY